MKLVLPAYAKLNLTLDVLGRRDDGYHEIASVLQTVSLHDLVAVELAPAWSLETIGLPISGQNLVEKAARRLEEHAGQALPLKVRLHKRIPIGAGLGGGSSDAATFLRAAIRLCALRVTEADLLALAASIGQDVPFLLHGGTAVATGRGSQLEPLPPLASSWTFLVVYAGVQVSTREVYAAVDGTERSDRRTAPLAATLRAGSQPSAGDFGNDLEPATRKLDPEVECASVWLRTLAPHSQMTGSGAAFFIAYSTVEAARAGLAVLRNAYPAWVCRPVPSWS